MRAAFAMCLLALACAPTAHAQTPIKLAPIVPQRSVQAGRGTASPQDHLNRAADAILSL